MFILFFELIYPPQQEQPESLRYLLCNGTHGTLILQIVQFDGMDEGIAQWLGLRGPLQVTS